jgi:hypothetical protein
MPFGVPALYHSPRPTGMAAMNAGKTPMHFGGGHVRDALKISAQASSLCLASCPAEPFTGATFMVRPRRLIGISCWFLHLSSATTVDLISGAARRTWRIP